MEGLKERARILIGRLNKEEKKKKISEIEAESFDSNFWKDNIRAAEKMKELAALHKELEDIQKIESLLESEKLEELEKLIKELEKYLYLGGVYDKNNAILTIHAGQGGVDAQDWASMLFRMYMRFFERRGWRHEVLNEAPGEEAGLKSVSILAEGEFVYGYLKGEQGTHRLVRLSPFNADKLRHTSFALVEVLPVIEKIEGLDIREEDLDWEFYRASSHGGQNVQKVSSAVRLKHIPTGITVTSQAERYQIQNRENALKLLKAKLWVLQEEKRKKEEEDLKGVYKPASWGNQIRSYVLHPYQLVKDLRTKVETGNIEQVLDGNIDEFIEAELKE
ncbi:peptide chain release factor 2 [Candidatus Parcubacteria bacterium]|nr:MAG: peptide chain release factor 2 [Candidatus Parcubacteria bacterium]